MLSAPSGIFSVPEKGSLVLKKDSFPLFGPQHYPLIQPEVIIQKSTLGVWILGTQVDLGYHLSFSLNHACVQNGKVGEVGYWQPNFCRSVNSQLFFPLSLSWSIWNLIPTIIQCFMELKSYLYLHSSGKWHTCGHMWAHTHACILYSSWRKDSPKIWMQRWNQSMHKAGA